MLAACAASRAHSDTSRRAASTQLIAVPQAPAPSTAALVINGASVARCLDWGSARRGLLLLLQVQPLERERREDHRREAAARHHVLDRLAQIGVDHRRASNAEQRRQLL